MLTVLFTVNNVLGFIPLAVNNSVADEPAEGPVSKRMRRLSVGGLELQQPEKGKTPATKNKSNVKSTKSSSQQMEPATGKNSTFDDEAIEDDDVNIDT